MIAFTCRQWLQESSRLMLSSWPTWGSRTSKLASNPYTPWTTPSWERGSYLGKWAYFFDLLYDRHGWVPGVCSLSAEGRQYKCLRSWTYSISSFFFERSGILSWVLRSYLTIIFPHTCKAPSQRMVFIYTTMRMELRIQMLPWKSFEMSLPSVSSPRLVKVMPLTNVLHVCVCVPETRGANNLWWSVCVLH